MSRPLRIEFDGAVYHITSRGDRRENIFEDDEDRLMLLEVLGDGLARFDASVLAWCLMSNHYHFVLRTRRSNLSRLMRHINGLYTQRYNRRHGKVGHLFQGRFKGILVQEDAYLAEVCRYVDLNPVRARMVEHPGDWPWSSYNAFTGRVPPVAWHEVNTVLSLIAPGLPRDEARQSYARFVAEGRGVRLWEDAALRGQVFLGDAAFAAKMQALLETAPGVEIPSAQRRPVAKPLESYFATAARDEAIRQAFYEGGYTQTAIAAQASLSVSRISRILRAVGGAKAKGKA